MTTDRRRTDTRTPRRRAGTTGPRLSVAGLAVVFALVTAPAAGQIPLSPPRDAGQTVTPAYEGWYPNPDGTFTLSFGYFNRNREEVVEIPVGADNFLSPGAEDRSQATVFYPQRHWGVFTVVVPADFGDQRLTWTLVNRGQTFAIPGHLHRDWLIDSKRDPASGNTPPVVRLEPDGAEGRGPDGVTAGPLAATVGAPLPLTAWVTDDEVRPPGLFGGTQRALALHWFTHRGPGSVAFGEAEPEVDPAAGGRATTTATFDTPGDYVLRLRVNDYSGVSAGGHSQCCWTNGYVRVTVTE